MTRLPLTLAALALTLVVAPAFGQVETIEGMPRKEDYSLCAPVALSVAARLLDRDVPLGRAKVEVGPATSDGGHDLAAIGKAASNLGLYPLGVRISFAELEASGVPAILHVNRYRDLNRMHFLVAYSAGPMGVVIVDPPRAAQVTTGTALANGWDGNALLLFDSREAAEAYRDRLASWDAGTKLWRFGLALPAIGAILATSWAFRRFRHGWVAALQSPRLRPARWVAAGGVFATLAVAAVAALSRLSPPPTSWARFPVRTVNLGVLSPGLHTASLELVNDGPKDLVITRVRSSCSCVRCEPPPSVAPGKSVRLPLKVAALAGLRTVNLTFESNDPAGPGQARLTFAGTTRPTIVYPVMTFQDARAGEPAQAECSFFVAATDSELVVESWSIDGGVPSQLKAQTGSTKRTHFTFDSSPNPKLDEVVFQASLRMPDRPLKTFGRLRLNYGREVFEYAIPVNCIPRRPIRPEVDHIVLSPLTEGMGGGTSEVHIATDPGVSVVVEEAPPWCKVELAPLPGAVRMSMRLTGGAATHKSGRVVLSSNRNPADRSEVSVQYYGMPER